jgi:hypothetical protein
MSAIHLTVVLTITIIQMFKRLILFIFALILSLGVDAKMYGLFYGIDGDNLGCPENDVTDLAELYRKNGGQVILVRGDGVTRKNVLDGLRQQAGACTPNDIIMFVYSGHGNNGYIQCGNQCVNFSEIKRIMSDCEARRKIVIIDACYSGSFVDQRHGKLTGENVIVLTSSRRNEESYETMGARNSHLFTALLDGLKGKADKNRDGMVVAKELHTYLKSNTNSILEMQHPTMKGRFNENTILYTYKRNGGTAPDKPSVKPNIKPTTPLPGVVPTTTNVGTNESASEADSEAAVVTFLKKYVTLKNICCGALVIGVVFIILRYFIAYKLLMKYL